MTKKTERHPDVRGGDPHQEPRTPADSQVTLAVGMNPSEANPFGNIHGGHIMKLVDEAGGMTAIRHARRSAVTVAVDSMVFLSPVRVGDLLTLRARVNWVGHTSIEVGIRVEAEELLTGRVTHTNSAYAVYVALDAGGQPTPVPPLKVETEEDRRRWEEGAERQKVRLSRAKRRVREP